LGAARFWGRDGHDVRGLKVHIDEHILAIQLVIGSGTATEYSYNIRFSRGAEGFHINVYPKDRAVGLGYSDGSKWSDLGTAPPSCLAIGTSAITVILRPADLPRALSPLELKTWHVQLHLLYYAEPPHEWFAFPGLKTCEGHLLSTRLLRAGCPPRTSAKAPSFPHPETTAEVVKTVYGLARTARSRTGILVYETPVYLGVPYLTPASDVFEVVIDEQTIVRMSRVDEVNLVGVAPIQGLPRSLRVQVRHNGRVVLDVPEYPVWNGYEAISIGLPYLHGVESCAPMPSDFIRAAAVTDIWGIYLYGAHDEWRTVHLRDYFDSTCARLARAGFTDVYVTSFLSYLRLEPMPLLCLTQEEHSPGACAIREDDLRRLVETAHRYGLRFHLMYNAYEHGVSRDYLWREDKPSTWIESLLDQYEEIIIGEAAMAERCGVDSFVLGWQDGTVSYRGHEGLWGGRWEQIIRSVSNVFSGMIEYNIVSWEDIENILTGRVPVHSYSGVGSFLYSQWNPQIRSDDDSVDKIYHYFETWLSDLARLKAVLQRPMLLEVSVQSYDGYLTHGWFDAAIGKVGPTGPDFFEQARIYEALFQAVRRTTAIDGLISYKYHWDDPFGPDLGVPALSRMDLEGSIRNKPAEAVVKKWLGSPTD